MPLTGLLAMVALTLIAVGSAVVASIRSDAKRRRVADRERLRKEQDRRREGQVWLEKHKRDLLWRQAKRRPTKMPHPDDYLAPDERERQRASVQVQVGEGGAALNAERRRRLGIAP